MKKQIALLTTSFIILSSTMGNITKASENVNSSSVMPVNIKTDLSKNKLKQQVSGNMKKNRPLNKPEGIEKPPMDMKNRTLNKPEGVEKPPMDMKNRPLNKPEGVEKPPMDMKIEH